MSEARKASVLGRFGRSVTWKIALIALGPVIGLGLTLALNQHADQIRSEADRAYQVSVEELAQVDILSSNLSLITSQVSSYLESRTDLVEREILVGITDAQKALDKLKASNDQQMRDSVENAELRLKRAKDSFGTLKEKVEAVGRTSNDGLTDDLDKMTEVLSALFDGATSTHEGFRPLAGAYGELRGVELRYRWKRDDKLENRIEFMRSGLIERLTRADFDRPQADMLLESVRKQKATYDSWRQGVASEREARDDTVGHAKRALAATAAIRDRADARQAEARRQNAAANDQAAQWSLITAALAALISVAIIFVIGRGIGKALSRLALAMRRVADGEADVEIPYTTRKDEIGDMAQALGVFQMSISERAELTRRSEEEGAARLSRARRVEAAISGFASSIESALQHLQSSADKMRQASETLDNDSRALTAQAEVAGNATAIASREVSSVAVAAEQLSKSVDEVSRQAVRSTEVADRAVQQSHRATSMMSELAAEADKIGGVVELIRSIAGQTNLLALNATIEAARAGEAGKGFAVVASEVKALANQTAQATEDIVSRINSIQSASGDVSQAIGQIGGILSEMSAIATSVASAVEEQSSAIATISDNVNEAARSSAEGASAIRDAESRASSSRSTSTEVAQAAQTVASEAVSLEGVVSTFLEEVRAA
ncbi:MAG: HAMP domain-containing methyl-accepting chemotaxis protein [Beijerinckiaceae bacterium]|nr:HAMP domain-containing methyl-accepting chemotaxis protein [Beijerinckiaceae bacterium]MCZ8301954.1 HAMP domain-containing methyl-accepting chemotaxis protein [Beijerinckiaceae bacterium]